MSEAYHEREITRRKSVGDEVGRFGASFDSESDFSDDSIHVPGEWSARIGVWLPQRLVARRLLPSPLMWLEQRQLVAASRRSRENARFHGMLAVELARIRTGDGGGRAR